MSVLCEIPDSKFFQTIPDLCDAAHSFIDNQVKVKLVQFGKMFAEHQVSKEFGLVMIHRHFDISENEVIVETLNDQKSYSVSSPWIVDGKTLVSYSDTLWKEHDTKMKEFVVPQTWAFDKNGILKPFEYLATDSPMRNPPSSFVAELYTELKNLGLAEILGIRRIDNVIGRPSWETTPEGTRSNLVVFGTKPDNVKEEESICVLWYFNDDGSIHQGAACVRCCHNCTKCSKTGKGSHQF